ncbi:O-methyltransferase, partial [Kineosporia succinea]
MMNTLTSAQTAATLGKLYRLADEAQRRPRDPSLAGRIDTMTTAEKSEAAAYRYMPVPPEGGRLLYALTRGARPQTVVEFGTSYGISTIHLAAAVADNGTGHVFTTELSEVKIAASRANLDEAGVGAHVTVLAGDALETLKDVPGPIGVVLLDGWKDLYLPVLRLLEDRLAPGALLVADNSSFDGLHGYMDHVSDPANGYVTVDLPLG